MKIKKKDLARKVVKRILINLWKISGSFQQQYPVDMLICDLFLEPS